MSFPPFLPYPAPRYDGADGETSASLRRATAAPDLTYPNGVRVDYLATGATTAGDYGLYRWTFGPEETGPGPHFHRTVAESFYVLTGQVRIYDGTEWVLAAPGDFVHVPPGGVHGFRNVAGAPASMLLHFTGRPARGLLRGTQGAGRGLRALRRTSAPASSTTTTTCGSRRSNLPSRRRTPGAPCG